MQKKSAQILGKSVVLMSFSNQLLYFFHSRIPNARIFGLAWKRMENFAKNFFASNFEYAWLGEIGYILSYMTFRLNWGYLFAPVLENLGRNE